MNIKPASVMVEGRPKRGAIVTCKCGVVAQVQTGDVNASDGDYGKVFTHRVSTKLEAKGWRVLKAKDGHSCPGCVSKHEATKPNGVLIVKDFKDMKANVTTLPLRLSEEPPLDLDRINRRIIHNKLEDVYIDEQTGYSPGWTDAKVALDLGVPRAWVATVRNDAFGPEGNEEISAAVTEAKAVCAALGQYIKDAQPIVAALPDMRRIAAMIPHVERIAVDLPEAQRKRDKVEKTIIETEKALRA